MEEAYRKYFNEIIFCLTTNSESIKKEQKIFDIVAAVLILTPIFVGGIIGALVNIGVALLIVVVCWGILAILAIMRRTTKIKKFYKVKDVTKKMKVISVTELSLLDELYDDSALTFPGWIPNNTFLNFIYNWLNNNNLLKNENINVYTFCEKDLKKKFVTHDNQDDYQYIAVFLKDLNITEENKEKFATEHFIVQARWLDDIVKRKK